MVKWIVIFAPYRKDDADDGSESLIARRIRRRRAKVASIPVLAEGVCLGDFVEIDEKKVVVEVLERATRRRRATFVESNDSERALWRQLRDYLRTWGIEAGPDPKRGEGVLPGVLLMAVPHDIDDEQLVEIAAKAPIPIELFLHDLALRRA